MQKKVKSDGSTASYYEIPPGAREIQDVISYLNANSQIGEIMRSCMRYGKVEHSCKLRDARKIKFYIEAEIERLLKYEPEECNIPGHPAPSSASSDAKGGEVPPEPVMPQNTIESDFQIPLPLEHSASMRDFEQWYLHPISPNRTYGVDRFVGAMATMNDLLQYEPTVVDEFYNRLRKAVGRSHLGALPLDTLWRHWHTMRVNTGR